MKERFFKMVNKTSGILEGNGSLCQHAVHNFYGNLYDPDPNGIIYKIEDHKVFDFFPTRLWVFTEHHMRHHI